MDGNILQVIDGGYLDIGINDTMKDLLVNFVLDKKLEAGIIALFSSLEYTAGVILLLNVKLNISEVTLTAFTLSILYS